MLIDIHAHVTPSKTVTRPNGDTYPTPDELLAMLDSKDVDKAVLLCNASPEHAHRRVSSEDVLAIAADHPDRFIPFCNLDPRMVTNSPDADFRPLLGYYKAAGCKGVGELTANLHFDDPMLENLFRHCEIAGMPVLFHIGPRFGGCYGLVDDPGLPRLEGVLRRFPNLVFIGHSQPFWAEISADVTEETRNGYPKGKVIPGRIPFLLKTYATLYADLSAGSGYNAVSRDTKFGYAFLEEFQDKLFFGQDICASHNEMPLVGFLREAHDNGLISDQAFEKIAWRNANRVLGLGL